MHSHFDKNNWRDPSNSKKPSGKNVGHILHRLSTFHWKQKIHDNSCHRGLLPGGGGQSSLWSGLLAGQLRSAWKCPDGRQGEDGRQRTEMQTWSLLLWHKLGWAVLPAPSAKVPRAWQVGSNILVLASSPQSQQEPWVRPQELPMTQRAIIGWYIKLQLLDKEEKSECLQGYQLLLYHHSSSVTFSSHEVIWSAWRGVSYKVVLMWLFGMLKQSQQFLYKPSQLLGRYPWKLQESSLILAAP